jgi:hypothetical protein
MAGWTVAYLVIKTNENKLPKLQILHEGVVVMDVLHRLLVELQYAISFVQQNTLGPDASSINIVLLRKPLLCR